MPVVVLTFLLPGLPQFAHVARSLGAWQSRDGCRREVCGGQPLLLLACPPPLLLQLFFQHVVVGEPGCLRIKVEVGGSVRPQEFFQGEVVGRRPESSSCVESRVMRVDKALFEVQCVCLSSP